MTVHSIETAKTARFVVLGSPDAPLDEVWIACHGYGQLATYFARHFRAAERPGRLIVVPEAQNRFYVDSANGTYERVGATWMTREDRESDIADITRYLDDVLVAACASHGADPRTVKLGTLGFSQGTATVMRWLALSPLLAARQRRADRVVLWGGGLPHDLDLSAERPWLGEADLTLVAGESDEIATPERIAKNTGRLDSARIPFRTLRYDGGHKLNAETLASVLAPLCS